MLNHHGNSHRFTRVLVDLLVQKVGVDVGKEITERYFDRPDRLYIGDGAGGTRRINDHNSLVIHSYGLVYAKAATSVGCWIHRRQEGQLE